MPRGRSIRRVNFACWGQVEGQNHTNRFSLIGRPSPKVPPLSRHSTSGHVICAVPIPIAIVAAVERPPPSLLWPLSVVSPLVTIALFVTVAIALAAIAIAFFVARHPSRCRNYNLRRQRSLRRPSHSLLFPLHCLSPETLVAIAIALATLALALFVTVAIALAAAVNALFDAVAIAHAALAIALFVAVAIALAALTIVLFVTIAYDTLARVEEC
jgi:hypothetical protein